MFQGFVEDDRTTDTAWVETVLMNCHGDIPNAFAKFDLIPSAEYESAEWMPVRQSLKLHLNHEDFIVDVRFDCEWHL